MSGALGDWLALERGSRAALSRLGRVVAGELGTGLGTRSALGFGMVGLTLAAPLTSAAVHISNELRDRSGRSAGAEPAPAPSG
jgi:hypothetical protein